MPAWALIAGRTLMAIGVSLVSMIVLLLVGRFAYGVRLPTRTIPGVAITAVVGSISFCVLAYAFRPRSRTKTPPSRWCRP